MKRLLASLVLLLCLPVSALADLSDCIDATCRIKAPDGSTGTGCVFQRDGGFLYVLTNYHVAGQVGSGVSCEFWRRGYGSMPFTGTVVWTSYHPSASRDIAVVQVPEGAFGAGPLPAVVPLVFDPALAPTADSTITSVGCPSGNWPSAWRGHVLRLASEAGEVCHFTPPPANGRSGSAIFDEDGEHIIGLLAWRSQDDSYGIAMTLAELCAAFAGQGPKATTAWRQRAKSLWIGSSLPTDCGPYGCSPMPRGAGGFSFFDFEWGNGRGRQQPAPTPAPTLPGAGTPWPGMPSQGTQPTQNNELVADVERLKARVSAIETAGTDLASRIAKIESIAVTNATATATVAAKIEAATEKVEAVEDQVVKTHETATEAVQVAESATKETSSLAERVAAVAKASDISIDDAMKRIEEAKASGATEAKEIAERVATSFIAEKLSSGAGGWLSSAGISALLSALGIGGPLALVLPFVAKRLGNQFGSSLGERLRERFNNPSPPVEKPM